MMASHGTQGRTQLVVQGQMHQFWKRGNPFNLVIGSRNILKTKLIVLEWSVFSSLCQSAIFSFKSGGRNLHEAPGVIYSISKPIAGINNSNSLNDGDIRCRAMCELAFPFGQTDLNSGAGDKREIESKLFVEMPSSSNSMCHGV